jgi:hypothetical protein
VPVFASSATDGWLDLPLRHHKDKSGNETKLEGFFGFLLFGILKPPSQTAIWSGIGPKKATNCQTGTTKSKATMMLRFTKGPFVYYCRPGHFIIIIGGGVVVLAVSRSASHFADSSDKNHSVDLCVSAVLLCSLLASSPARQAARQTAGGG